MTTDPSTLVDDAKSAVEQLGNLCLSHEEAFRNIVDIARSIDETNWKDKVDDIFSIAYNHF